MSKIDQLDPTQMRALLKGYADFVTHLVVECAVAGVEFDGEDLSRTVQRLADRAWFAGHVAATSGGAA